MSERSAKGASAKASAVQGGDHQHAHHSKERLAKGTPQHAKELEGKASFTTPAAFPAAPAATASPGGPDFRLNLDEITQEHWDKKLEEDLFRGGILYDRVKGRECRVGCAFK